jgi:uncharacterized integral membrane protein
MGDLWLKIKVWSKIGIFALVTIYLLLFIIFNSNQDINIWVWFDHTKHPTLLELIVSLLFAGMVITLLGRMAYRTIRQIKDMRYRNQTAQLSKDLADMKAKADMLVTKPAAGNPPAAPPPSPR